jgi:hypothetical protein
MGACTLGPTLAFPMCDGTGRICGIRTRSLEGSKKSVTGSRSGVFLPTIHMEDLMPIICEGPTDAAAAMALGFEPIGRPSCSGSERHVIDTCRRLGHTRVTLCADADGPGISPSGHKDLRDWWRAGTSRETVEQAWSQAEWR